MTYTRPNSDGRDEVTAREQEETDLVEVQVIRILPVQCPKGCHECSAHEEDDENHTEERLLVQRGRFGSQKWRFRCWKIRIFRDLICAGAPETKT
eukprot:6468385-Amphidinium_carterae.1